MVVLFLQQYRLWVSLSVVLYVVTVAKSHHHKEVSVQLGKKLKLSQSSKEPVNWEHINEMKRNRKTDESSNHRPTDRNLSEIRTYYSLLKTGVQN